MSLLDRAGRFLSDLPWGLDGELLVDFAVAALLVVGGWYLSKLLVRALGRPIARRFERPSVTNTVLQGLRVGVLLLTFGAAANVLGVAPGELLLSGAVFAAVLAVVLAPIVGSFVSGLFVLADQPFEIGDMIELVDEDTRGYVDDITLRYTKMFTLDNTFIVVPNSMIRDRDIINYSAEDPRTRESMDIVVTYEGDLDEARKRIERAARKVEGVVTGGPAIRIGTARYPAAPTTYITEFGDHGVEIQLRYWVETPYRLQTARSAVHERVWSAIQDVDVEIAYPHSHIVFDETSGQANVAVSRSSPPRPDSPEPSDASEPAGSSESSASADPPESSTPTDSPESASAPDSSTSPDEPSSGS